MEHFKIQKSKMYVPIKFPLTTVFINDIGKESTKQLLKESYIKTIKQIEEKQS